MRRAYERANFEASTDARTGIIGYVGTTVPLELISAAGLWPLRLTAHPAHPLADGDAYMEEELGWEQRSIFDAIVSGRSPAVDMLVVDRGFAAMFLYLKEVVRLGQGAAVPPLYVFDFVPSREPSIRRYNERRVHDLIDALGRRAGEPIADDAWRSAAATGNRRRQLLRTLMGCRQQRRLSGVMALQIIGAGYFMTSLEYIDCLARVLDALKTERVAQRGPRVVVLSSEALYHVLLHDALEEAGGVVVGEDDWWGSRAAGARINEDLSMSEAVLEMCAQDATGPGVHPYAARLEWLSRQLSLEGASTLDAVIVYMPPTDHVFGWDYPRIRSLADRAGVPHLVIRDDVLTEDGAAAIRATAKDFIAGLSSKAG